MRGREIERESTHLEDRAESADDKKIFPIRISIQSNPITRRTRHLNLNHLPVGGRRDTGMFYFSEINVTSLGINLTIDFSINLFFV